MKLFLYLTAALLLLSLSSIEASLEEICKKVDQAHENIDFNFCITSLQVVPESHTADVQGIFCVDLFLRNPLLKY